MATNFLNNEPQNSSSTQEEANDLKIKAIGKIMEIQEEAILFQIARYLEEEKDFPEENLTTCCVKEPAAAYSPSYPPDKLKLMIIQQILKVKNTCIPEFLYYLDQITTKEKASSLPALEEALEDIEKGRVYKAATVADLFKQILEK